MAKRYTKIQYEYHFSNLDIYNDDIQELYNHIMYKIITFAEVILKFPIHNNIAIPDLFISDEIVTKTYKIYDYDYILKLINSFLEKYPFSKFNPILADFRGIIRSREESNSIKELPYFVEELEEIINKSEPSTERNAVKKIASNLKSPKSTVRTLGEYYSNNNKIILYINSVIGSYENAPNADLRTKILTGLEIVFAHELFHAIHFNLIDGTHAQRKKLWSCQSKDKEARKSVVEGLARWFEYEWCIYRHNHNSCSATKPVYDWCIQEIIKELHSHTYPDWPYAATRAFINNGSSNYCDAHDVLRVSLHQHSNHWNDAYELLKKLDHYNNNNQSISSTINSNPKLIFLTNPNQLTTEF